MNILRETRWCSVYIARWAHGSRHPRSRPGGVNCVEALFSHRVTAVGKLLTLTCLGSTDSMDDMSSEMNDLGNIGLAVRISMIHSLQVNIQCNSGFAAAILDVSLPVTFDSTDS